MKNGFLCAAGRRNATGGEAIPAGPGPFAPLLHGRPPPSTCPPGPVLPPPSSSTPPS
ncbi:hypothetical protein DB31_5128 [Hyalangium minutum]|uniref:Uncharacterized protein n=1 Tax=Hyalangium minutum TaxID=394096 RepID=A0A085WQX3_9BACT|nr:hypothetical protein DB31_5128 [Hyalangium minutum]